MWRIWMRRGGCIGSWLGNRRERDHWVDLGVDGWIILGRISRRWDVGIWTGFGLVQDRDRWRTLVSAVMNLRLPWNAGNFLTSYKPVSFSRRTLHHGVSKLDLIHTNYLRLLCQLQSGCIDWKELEVCRNWIFIYIMNMVKAVVGRNVVQKV